MDAALLGLLASALLNGLLLGLVYAAMSVGLSLTMGVMRVVNVAHSTFVILGSFFGLLLFQQLGLDPLLGVLLALPVFFAVGAVLERLLIKPILRAPETTGLLVLFGVLVVVESATTLTFTNNQRALTVGYSSVALNIVGGGVPLVRIVAAAVSLVLIAATDALLRFTLLGKGMRAMAQNRDAAAMLGVDIAQLSMIVFGLGIATAAVGGIALAMVFPFAPPDHMRWLAWAFLVVILGGLGSVRNTTLAGLVVGLIESFAGALLPFQYVYAVVYLALALALLLRTEGLAGARRRLV